jgi:hypothetical protein
VPKTERIVFDWQSSRSEASHKGWEGRWERGEAVGPKGEAYLERVYGPVEIDYRDDYADYFDFEDVEAEY